MKKYIPFLLSLLSYSVTAQVGINATGTAPAPAAMLDVSSTNKGVLIPRMNTVQKGDIPNKVEGLMVYDTDAHQFSYWTGSLWVNFGTAVSPAGWAISGNAGNELKNTNAGGFWSAATTGLDFNTTNSTNPPTAPVGSAGTRLMWIPSRSAFRVGTIYDDGSNGGSNWDGSKIGLFSFATGLNTTASGRISTALGNFTSAIGNASTAMGNITTASGVAATATGNSTYATGDFSTAMGSYGSTNGKTGSFIIHDNINENVFGITYNSADNQMVMKFDGGFGFYSGGASDASMGFEKTIGLSVYGKGIRAFGGGNIYTENGGKIGVNTATPNATLQVNGGVSMPIKALTGSYTVQDSDYTLEVNLPDFVTADITLPNTNLAPGRIINVVILNPNCTVRIIANSNILEILGSHGRQVYVMGVNLQCGTVPYQSLTSGQIINGWVKISSWSY